MPRICTFTGRKTSGGKTYTHRGKAKYLGGVGTKVTGKSNRTFRANIQTVIALVDGSVQRIKVSTKAIKMGLVTKPLRRKYAYRPGNEEPVAKAAPPPESVAVSSDEATAGSATAEANQARSPESIEAVDDQAQT